MSNVSPTLAEDLRAMVGDLVLADEPVDADTDLLLEGLVDSLGVMQIVAWLEEQLGIEIDPIDIVIDNFRSVDAIVAYLERRAAPTQP